MGARNDFLGRSFSGAVLSSFGINPGGYVGFFDPTTGSHETFAVQGDPVATLRFRGKARAKEARRAIRYRKAEEREKIRRLSVPEGASMEAAADIVAAALEAAPPAPKHGESRFATGPIEAGED